MPIRRTAVKRIGCTVRNGGGKGKFPEVRSDVSRAHWPLGKHTEVRGDVGVL